MCFDEDCEHVVFYPFWDPKMSPFGPILGSCCLLFGGHPEGPRLEPIGLRPLFGAFGTGAKIDAKSDGSKIAKIGPRNAPEGEGPRHGD